MDPGDALLATLAETLDGLDVAFCAFDAEDRTRQWNRAFLRYFPEHAGKVRVGEPYRDNLRRFFQHRLSLAQLPEIERYIDEGVQRHRGQTRPFVFQHHGTWLRVSSQALADGGRLRVWSRAQAPHLAGNDALPEGLDVEGDPHDVFEHVGDGVMITAADNRITWANMHFLRLYGLADKAVAVGLDFEDVYRGAWRAVGAESEACAAGLTALQEHMRSPGPPFELPLPGQRWVRIFEQRRFDGVGFFAHVDITLLKRQQQDLIAAERRARASETLLAEKSRMLEATLDRMEQGVMMVSPERVVEVCNRRAIELLGLPPEMMARKPTFTELLEYQWSTGEFVYTPEHLLDFVRKGGILDQLHCYDRMRPDGRIIEVHSVPIEGGGVLRTFTDITERKRQEERIRHLAHHDGLTSLVNREGFLAQVATAIVDPSRLGGGFAVHYLDLDEFKPVNDRLGHAAGDRVLAAVADRLRHVARDHDIVGRMGGDEFALLQAGAKDPIQALQLARRAIASVQEPIEVDGHVVRVGLSVGISLYPGRADSVDGLMRLADQALYSAKAAGRGNAQVAQPEPPPAGG